MAKRIQHLSLTLGSRKPFMDSSDSAMGRLAIVLHTPIGNIPWRPKFGCNLNHSVGRPASEELQNNIRDSVRRAVDKWLPDAEVEHCEIHVSSDTLNVASHRELNVPLAESALVSFGTEVHAEVALEITVEGEPLELSTVLDIE
jgi:phage baseplate assembly protein W